MTGFNILTHVAVLNALCSMDLILSAGLNVSVDRPTTAITQIDSHGWCEIFSIGKGLFISRNVWIKNMASKCLDNHGNTKETGI
ncbi:MAG: hypothetical protein ACYDAO_10085 [Thermoplasmataceae archaeon]